MSAKQVEMISSVDKTTGIIVTINSFYSPEISKLVVFCMFLMSMSLLLWASCKAMSMMVTDFSFFLFVDKQ